MPRIIIIYDNHILPTKRRFAVCDSLSTSRSVKDSRIV